MATGDANPIVWTDVLTTGIQEMDEQHRILVDTLNDANMRLTDDCSLDLIEQITRDLLSYALYHFETEEQLMQDYDYGLHHADEAEQHMQQHRSFSAKVVAVRNEIKAGRRVPRDDLLAFLNGWLVNHIMNTDKHLGEFVARRRATE